ncbi:MAG: phosphotransferase [Bdellovibrionaceae bacterium]|nr:phosphotransferase [Pseudobdellovibrionaceae bacterium]
MAQFIIEEDSQLHDFVRKSLNASDFSIFPLAGDASSRKYYRVASGDNSWVLMKWEPVAQPESYPFLSIQKHLGDHNINVPKIFEADYSSGLYLLEDLGDLTLERKFWENLHQENVLPFYKVTLDQLAILHRLSLDKKNLSQCTAYSVKFDTEKFKWELNYTLTYLFKTFLKMEPSNETAVQKEFELLAKTLAEIPSVLSHRDFHSRNLMIKSNKIYFIDFQDARLGPPQYDLVSLIHDSYVQLNNASQTSLVDYYLEMFPEALKLYSSKKDFMNYYNLQTLQRCFKACGTFAAINAQRDDTRYLKYLPHTLTKVRHALDNTNQFPMIQEMVSNITLPDLETWP